MSCTGCIKVFTGSKKAAYFLFIIGFAMEKEKHSEKKETTREEIYFSPVVLDVMEEPPAPFAHAMMLFIFVFALFVTGWSIFAKMDIVVTGTGKVIPRGKVKLVQPLEPGIVTAIHVRDGQLVKKGELLISMDSTDVVTDLATTRKDLDKIGLDILRLRAELSGDTSEFMSVSEEMGDKYAVHANLLTSSVMSHREHLASLDKQISSLTAEKQSVEAEKKRNEISYPLARELYSRKKKLAEKRLISKAEFIEEQIALNNARQNLKASVSMLDEVSSRLDKAVEERALANTQYRRDLLSRLTEAENEKERLTQQLEKAKNRQTHFELRAPSDGIVQQLAVNNTDSVVTAAQTLLVVVPLDDGLEIEAQILNKDIGYVHKGQDVSIKVAAYPFTKYGDLPGRIEWVANDAVMDEQAGPVYPVKISVSSYKLPNIVQGREGFISPGMIVTADIKVGKRRVFEYFLDPVMRYKDKSLREI